MEEVNAFQSQLSSIMEKLVFSAVTEINQLMVEYCAVLRLQLSGKEPDNNGGQKQQGASRDNTQLGTKYAGTQTQAEQTKSEGATEELKEGALSLIGCKIEPTPATCDDPPEVPDLRVTPSARSATCPQPAEFCPHSTGQRSELSSDLPEDSKDPHADYDPSVEMQCHLSLSPDEAEFPELGFHIKREAESPDVQTQNEDLKPSFELQQGILGLNYTDSGAFPVDGTLPDTQMPTCFSSLQASENHLGNPPESSSSRQQAADRLTPCHQFGRRKNAQYRTAGRFPCDFCGKAFPYLSAMKGHRLSHTRERSHVCRHCGKTFIRRSHLNRHEIIHVDVKRFSCQICGFSFSRRAQLSAHLRTHSM